MLRTTLTAALAAVLAGCVSTTPTYQTESAFVIYDVRPASINRNALLDAITQAVQKHMTQVRANRDIPPAELPESPGDRVEEAAGQTGVGHPDGGERPVGHGAHLRGPDPDDRSLGHEQGALRRAHRILPVRAALQRQRN